MENQEFYNRLIKPIRDNYISELIDSVSCDVFSPYDKHFTWGERKTPIYQLRNLTGDWTKPYIEGLENFPYFYIMNGNTDSLNTIFESYKDPFSWKQGDYSYYDHYHKVHQKNYKELRNPETVDNLVLTWPGYKNGDNQEYLFSEKCNAKYKHLDCAYLGLVEPSKINVSSFETVSISFSKSLSIPYNRIGVLFSKQPISSLETLNKLGYVNLSGVNLANFLLSKVPPDYWWSRYSTAYQDICRDNNLTPSKCLLFAYDGDTRTSIAPLWTKFLQK